MGNAQDCISFVDDAIKIGGMTFPGAKDACSQFTVLAGFVIKVLNLQKDDGLAESLRRLNASIDRLERQMRDGFRSVEALIVRNAFTTNIVVHVNTLDSLMTNIFTSEASTYSIEAFKAQCNIHQPHALLLDIIHYLRSTDANPIRYSMKEKPWESTNIGIIWHKQIAHLAGKLAMLHGMFVGLTEHGSDGTMEANISELEKTLDDFLFSFQMDYWPDVTSLVESTMDNRQDIGNAQKADIIRDHLKGLHTSDQFYIMVYDATQGHGEHSFRYNPDNTLVRFRRGKCCMVIYASKNAQWASSQEYNHLKEKVEGWRQNGSEGWITSTEDMKHTADRVKVDIPFSGFIGLIKKDHNPQIRSTGHLEWGPGWWITAKGTHDRRRVQTGGGLWGIGNEIQTIIRDTVLIVGFP